MFDPLIISIIIVVFILAGCVKGVIGLGLPTVSLGLLAVTLDLTTAMALMIIPAFLTNLWQTFSGPNLMGLLRRLWPFLFFATVCIGLGAMALTRINNHWLAMLLGLLLMAYAVLNLSGVKFSLTPTQEKWAGPVLGAVNGVFTGMTGSYMVPGVLYLQALRISRDELVQAMGMLFGLSTIGLALALQSKHLMTMDLAVTSSLAVIPAIMGMLIGQRIRKGLSESLFRQVFFVSLLILGVFLIIKTALLN